MKKGTNFDISLTRTETLYLLKPDRYGKSISDNHNIGIMCKEYGDDDDWVGLSSEDYETILEDATTYKTFEIWLSNEQDKDMVCRFIKSLNIPQEQPITIAVLCQKTNEVDIITANMPDDSDMIESFLTCHCQYSLENINWMVCKELKINHLTEKSFEH